MAENPANHSPLEPNLSNGGSRESRTMNRSPHELGHSLAHAHGIGTKLSA